MRGPGGTFGGAGLVEPNTTSGAASNPSMSGLAFRKLTLPTRNVLRDEWLGAGVPKATFVLM